MPEAQLKCAEPNYESSRGLSHSIRHHQAIACACLRKALSRFCDRGPYAVPRTLRLRFERVLKVLRINTRIGSLRPRHLRSSRPVNFDELRLGRASGECEEAGALCNSLGPRLRPLRFCGPFGFRCSLFRLHDSVPPLDLGRYHTRVGRES